ncbi:aminoglycoside 3-N-acetyltransferase [Thermocatellispora tengchongensis]|uniref:Aminoglycoside N(3)-acetyltransferase n=1 Tax=Thermocatellispora tengchongensis TaxID=1073253 RepID=A0A840P5B8_9ACTN|nr:AAC(3) family N-acetyltransferase [Thermocatellispora tengchongensis]MBB5134868.1 aminoglycoside 3-N-acetyltransferase [Thermocatellispora tengchongensis]
MAAPTLVRPRDLARHLRDLGVRRGQTLLVHASMSSVGWVEGGAAAIVAVLRGLLGPEGTLVVPTLTTGNSDTSPEYLRAIAGMGPDEVAAYRARMPAFDPATTPSTGMGRIAEEVRTCPGAYRSAHPQSSFAAVGRRAGELMDGHAPDCHYGPRSPLARLYETGAHVLLLGVGFDRCTGFHLAEYRYTENPPTRSYRCVVDFGTGPMWWEYQDVVLDDRDMGRLGADFERTVKIRRGRVGNADTRLFPLASAVDYAICWYASRRKP